MGGWVFSGPWVLVTETQCAGTQLHTQSASVLRAAAPGDALSLALPASFPCLGTETRTGSLVFAPCLVESEQ